MHIAVLLPIALEKNWKDPTAYINGVHSHTDYYTGLIVSELQPD